jgi:hypothetical protein
MMPPSVSLRQHIVLIDKEWASTLIGLPVLVSNSWWKGYKRDGNRLNAGTIVGKDFNQPHSNYFQLKCVGDIYYAMQYDAVYLYADLNHANYDVMKFCLPMVAPANPVNSEVIAPGK